MKSRIFILNNEKYIFNFYKFNNYFNEFVKEYNYKISKLEYELGEYVNRCNDAIHNWRLKKNGPSDIETIKLICNFFNIENYKILLCKKQHINKNELNRQQVLSIKRIYDKIIEYLQDFYTSFGFNDYWLDLDVSNLNKENALYELINSKLNRVILTFMQEYIFLKNTQIYHSIKEYIYNDLYDIFDGKISYAYRFENMVEDSVEEDYYKALDKINEIVSNYLD